MSAGYNVSMIINKIADLIKLRYPEDFSSSSYPNIKKKEIFGGRKMKKICLSANILKITEKYTH